jgi:hypothetical protein
MNSKTTVLVLVLLGQISFAEVTFAQPMGEENTRQLSIETETREGAVIESVESTQCAEGSWHISGRARHTYAFMPGGGHFDLYEVSGEGDVTVKAVTEFYPNYRGTTGKRRFTFELVVPPAALQSDQPLVLAFHRGNAAVHNSHSCEKG